MSHFTVTVVLPPGKSLDTALEPFYEQGDPGDYFMQFEDHTDQLKEEYETGTVVRILLEDETLVSPYDKMWDVQEEGKSFSTRVIPEHLERVDVPFKELYETFEEFVQQYHGMEPSWALRDGRWGYWSNPNAKWDWWTEGGRWGGLFELKPNYAEIANEPYNLIDNEVQDVRDAIDIRLKQTFWTYFQVEEFKKKVESGELAFDNATEEIYALAEYIGAITDGPRCDGALAAQIDWVKMEARRVRNRIDEWYAKKEWCERRGIDLKEISELLKEFDAIPYSEFPKGDDRAKHPVVSRVDEIFKDMKPNFALEEGEEKSPWEFMDRRTMEPTLEEWMAGYTRPDALTWSLLTAEGEWYENGDMGWFGTSDATEETKITFGQLYWNYLEKVPGHYKVYLVDCHI